MHVFIQANFVFFKCYGDHRDLHSFPSRRSSELQPLSLGETVAWSWAQASKVEGVTVQFRAWFAAPPSGHAFAFPYQGGLPDNAAVVEQDDDTRTWRAEATGEIGRAHV